MRPQMQARTIMEAVLGAPGLAAAERAFGLFGGVERRGGVRGLSEFVVDDLRAHTSREAATSGRLVVRGHAAVFNRLSLDLGFFRERIAEGAFDRVLDAGPHVSFNLGHDDRWILTSTRVAGSPLELRTDPQGLRFYAPAVRGADGAKLSYEDDVRIWMEAGLYRQCSFKFMVGADEWLIDSDDNITRTILEVSDLYDVCVCEFGAYPQTDAEMVRNILGSRHMEAVPDQQEAVPAEEAGPPDETTAPESASRELGDGEASELVDLAAVRLRRARALTATQTGGTP